jgi:hypothetical protein
MSERRCGTCRWHDAEEFYRHHGRLSRRGAGGRAGSRIGVEGGHHQVPF